MTDYTCVVCGKDYDGALAVLACEWRHTVDRWRRKLSAEIIEGPGIHCVECGERVSGDVKARYPSETVITVECGYCGADYELTVQ